jgi:twinkle protein
VKKIIVAVDGDKPGEELGEELARRLGKHRCWRVTWPEGCKDANDVLVNVGKDRLADAIKEAAAWPVAGLYEAISFKDALWGLYKGTGGSRVSTGYPTLDRLYSVSPGLLTVLTGTPGSGKSTFIDQLMVNLSDREDWVHGVCSFENEPTMHIGKLLQMKLGKHFFSEQMGLRMSEAEVEDAFPWVNTHFKFIAQDNGGMPIETILENARIAVMRWGLKGLVIDPYSYITRPKNMESEVKWVGDVLAQARMFAASYGVHVWFVAHPYKMHDGMDGEAKIPKGYDISGSAEWFNKPDFGLTVHRFPGDNMISVVCWKRRFEWLGKEGATKLLYQEPRHRYFEEFEGYKPWHD